MGYTHYFTQGRHATPEEWDRIQKDFEYLLASAALPPVQYEDDVMEDPRIDSDVIRFNGVGKDGHETMLLQREGDGFECCKTARKDYDRAVTALLILAHHHAPDVWQILSDGDPEDWEDGLEVARRAQEGARIPEGL